MKWAVANADGIIEWHDTMRDAKRAVSYSYCAGPDTVKRIEAGAYEHVYSGEWIVRADVAQRWGLTEETA